MHLTGCLNHPHQPPCQTVSPAYFRRSAASPKDCISFPSAGKSTLMSKLTGQHSCSVESTIVQKADGSSSAASLTLCTIILGQVQYDGAAIQMLDLPGIIQGAKGEKDQYHQLIPIAETCHLIFTVLDVIQHSPHREPISHADAKMHMGWLKPNLPCKAKSPNLPNKYVRIKANLSICRAFNVFIFAHSPSTRSSDQRLVQHSKPVLPPYCHHATIDEDYRNEEDN